MLIGVGSGTTDHGLQMGFRGAGNFFCGFWGDDFDSTTTPDSGWHLWDCTYAASTRTMTLYEDGSAIGTKTMNANFQGSGPVYVGAFPVNGLWYTGSIDEAAIYLTALSQTRVQALKRPGFPRGSFIWQPGFGCWSC